MRRAKGLISRADWINGVNDTGQDNGEEVQPLKKSELDLQSRRLVLWRDETGVLEQH